MVFMKSRFFDKPVKQEGFGGLSMEVNRGQVLELTVGDVAFGGKGIAKVDGFAVFVDKTVTGDKVKVQITRRKKN
jgi:23S rRNA (uracil1939-C5)-methyltransferase